MGGSTPLSLVCQWRGRRWLVALYRGPRHFIWSRQWMRPYGGAFGVGVQAGVFGLAMTVIRYRSERA